MSLSFFRQLDEGETSLLRYGYYSIVTFYLCTWLFVARAYRPDARLLPITVSALVLGLIAIRGITGCLVSVETKQTAEYQTDDSTAVDDSLRAGVAFGWFAGLLLTVVLIGLIPGIVVVVTGFVARYDQVRRAIIIGPATGSAVYVIFVIILELPSYDPLLPQLLGGIIGG